MASCRSITRIRLKDQSLVASLQPTSQASSISVLEPLYIRNQFCDSGE